MKRTSIRMRAYIIAAISLFSIYSVYYSEFRTDDQPFHLGLDIRGGARLTYTIDTSTTPSEELKDALVSLQEVIERRVNVLGVSEPVIRTSTSSIAASSVSHRLIVELPGVTDIDSAVDSIGKTPLLEFRLLKRDPITGEASFEETGITGSLVQGAAVTFPDQGSPHQAGGNGAWVRIDFNKEGTALFRDITTNNIGEILSIFLDGEIESNAVIQTAIVDGTGIIQGNFIFEEARELARNLNFGALPLGVDLEGVETIGASLGQGTIEKGAHAGLIGFLLIALFLISWYRVSGVVAVLSLATYISLMLLLFKWIPVILTAAGVAGFIITIGIAVDANILIFERLREELLSKKPTKNAIETAFERAWKSIRDGNLTSFIIAVILFWFGTSLVRGFAFTFGLGILVSMLTAIIFSRGYLRLFGVLTNENALRLLTRGKK